MKELTESLKSLKQRESQIYAETELEEAYRDGIVEGIDLSISKVAEIASEM